MAPMATAGDPKSAGSTEYELKKYLLLLATLVATVTYAAGLNLPGGTWVEDPPEGQLSGDSILRATNYMRYIVFFYFNAIAFSMSLLAGLLLLILHKKGWLLLFLVRAVMVADLFALMGAYTAGISHDMLTTTCGAAMLASCVVAGMVTQGYYSPCGPSSSQGSSVATVPETAASTIDEEEDEKEREILLVLAIFAATIAYVAGLNPPGGFWRSSQQEGEGHGHHTAGEPVLQGLHRNRYRAFFFFNTIAFTASLLAVMLIVSSHRQHRQIHSVQACVTKSMLYVTSIIALVGLWGAYTFGSCRDFAHTVRVVLVLFVVLVVSTVLQVFGKHLAAMFTSCCASTNGLLTECVPKRFTSWASSRARNCWSFAERSVGKERPDDKSLLDKAREDIQLLAILAATIAYQAAVDPPGGVWVEGGEGHKVGDPILLTTHPIRYKIFYYSNSAAFVASLVIMVMLQWEDLVRKHALQALMILDLFGLIGAFAAGSCRDVSTSFYTVALAGAVLVYVVIHIVFFTMEGEEEEEKDKDEEKEESEKEKKKKKKEKEKKKLLNKREVLLLLSILAATLTYQAGLTPPGGCWEKDDASGLHHAGFPVLLDKYPRRYMTFYYCNAAGFMASVALIVLLMNHNLYGPGIRCYALYVCMVAGMLSLMGAYSAGGSFHLRASIIVLVLAAVLAVVCFAVALFLRCECIKQSCCGGQKNKKKEEEEKSSSSDLVKAEEAGGGEVEGTINGGHGQPNSQQYGSSLRKAEESGGGGGGKVLGTARGGQGQADSHQYGLSSIAKDEEAAGGGQAVTNKDQKTRRREGYAMMYLMLVGILGASVTYLTGLKPPGGVWREDDVDGRYSAGNPVLYDTRHNRYSAFFYSNSVSFMASITIIASLLLRMILRPRWGNGVVRLGPMHAAMVLDLLALLGAYAAGSARKWGTSTKVVLLIIPSTLLIVWLFLFCNNRRSNKAPQDQQGTDQHQAPQDQQDTDQHQGTGSA